MSINEAAWCTYVYGTDYGLWIVCGYTEGRGHTRVVTTSRTILSHQQSLLLPGRGELKV